MNLTRPVRTIGTLLLCLILAGPAFAGMRVHGPFTDTSTGGDWRGTYGECFYLIPDPVEEQTRYFAGPDWCSETPGQYRYVACFGGSLFSRNPEGSKVDFRLHRQNSVNAAATVWRSQLEVFEQNETWNPCLQRRDHTTFANGKISSDPLTADLLLNLQGHVRLAYYFANPPQVCREQLVTLVIDGEVVAEGSVGDFATGKYVVFEIENFNPPAGGSIVSLETEDAPGNPECETADVAGVNTHLSAVFVDPLGPGSNGCQSLIAGSMSDNDDVGGGGKTSPPASTVDEGSFKNETTGLFGR